MFYGLSFDLSPEMSHPFVYYWHWQQHGFQYQQTLLIRTKDNLFPLQHKTVYCPYEQLFAFSRIFCVKK